LSNIGGPEVIAMVRFGITSLCLLPLLDRHALKKISLKNIVTLILASFFGMFLYSYFLFSAVKYTSSVNIALVNATMPILTLFISCILYSSLPTPHQLSSFVLSFIGVTFVITKGIFDKSILTTSYGEFLMLIGAFTWVIYGFLIKNLMHSISPLLVTFLTCFSGFALLLFYTLYNHHIHLVGSLTNTHWIVLLYIGILGTAVTFWLYADIIREIGPKKTNLFIFSIVPLAAMLLAYMLFGTIMNFWQILGACCVGSALALQAK
jgi:drug/metabolite transporter (DMT)-like permease